MATKTIGSTQAQNRFGEIMNDVTQNNIRYIIKRHNSSQAIILSLKDFKHICSNLGEQKTMLGIISEVSKPYCLGEAIQGENTDSV